MSRCFIKFPIGGFRRTQYIPSIGLNYKKVGSYLEEINYSVEKKGAKGKVLGETGVKVNKKIYKDWDLKDLYTMNFKKWFKDPKHQKLFTEGRV